MKLSKNRLHKIKGKKNSSRKKNNFRKRKGKKSYENTKKRHKRTHNLRKKTLKIYVGGDETEQQKEERLKKLEEKNKKVITELNTKCNSLTKLPQADEKNNTTVSNYIYGRYTPIKLRKNPVLKEYGNSKLYRIETSAQGDCLYDSVVFGLLYAHAGKWNNLQGWIPQQNNALLAGGSFSGNLRLVLQHYICNNSGSILQDKIMSTTQLSDAFKRLGNSFKNKPGSDGSGYGESEEIQLLARMFDVCIYVYSLNENEGTQVYNNTGDTIIEKDDIAKCKKENTISIVHASNDHFQNVLAIADTPIAQQNNRLKLLLQKEKQNMLTNEENIELLQIKKKLKIITPNETENLKNLQEKQTKAKNVTKETQKDIKNIDQIIKKYRNKKEITVTYTEANIAFNDVCAHLNKIKGRTDEYNSILASNLSTIVQYIGVETLRQYDEDLVFKASEINTKGTMYFTSWCRTVRSFLDVIHGQEIRKTELNDTLNNIKEYTKNIENNIKKFENKKDIESFTNLINEMKGYIGNMEQLKINGKKLNIDILNKILKKLKDIKESSAKIVGESKNEPIIAVAEDITDKTKKTEEFIENIEKAQEQQQLENKSVNEAEKIVEEIKKSGDPEQIAKADAILNNIKSESATTSKPTLAAAATLTNETYNDSTEENQTEDNQTEDNQTKVVEPFTRAELFNMYNKYKKDDVFTKKSLIRCLIAKDDEGERLRHLFGFPDKLSMSSFTTGTPINKVFTTILSTVYGTGGITRTKNSDEYSGVENENNITLKEFIDLIDCGTKRDKNKEDFKCKNVLNSGQSAESTNEQGATPPGATPPEPATPPGETPPGATPPGATPPEPATPPGETPEPATPPGETPEPGEAPPGETPPGQSAEGATPPGEAPPEATPVDATPVEEKSVPPTKPPRPSAPPGSPATVTPVDDNIKVDISKQVFEDENFKRVDLSIFIPKADSKVIVRNYANDTARQTIENMATFGV
jgi:hypothetical protein